MRSPVTICSAENRIVSVICTRSITTTIPRAQYLWLARYTERRSRAPSMKLGKLFFAHASHTIPTMMVAARNIARSLPSTILQRMHRKSLLRMSRKNSQNQLTSCSEFQFFSAWVTKGSALCFFVLTSPHNRRAWISLHHSCNAWRKRHESPNQ